MTVRIHELVKVALERNASDIHFGAGDIPALRVDGEVQRLPLPVLTNDDAKRLAYSMMLERNRIAFENNLETDFAIAFKGLARFRVNAFTHGRGMGIAMRRIPSRVLSIDELGLKPIFRKISEFKRGLILVTGPTGQGKSTTLAAMVDHINHSRRDHILTIEDPVEFVHTPDKCLINQREVGPDTQSFANALRSALREDPDVILVGELRDLETVSLALTAAETGHLVFGTMHTNSAPETVDRLIDSFPHEQQAQVRTMLSTALMAVISQALLKRIHEPGRVAVQEIMLCNAAIRNLIRENKLFQIPSMMQAGKSEGQQLMEMHAKELALAKKITRDDAMRVSNNPKLFDDTPLPNAPPQRAAAR